MSGATATVNRSLAFNRGVAASTVGAADELAAAGASGGGSTGAAELSGASTDSGSVLSRLSPPFRLQSRTVATSPAARARTSTTLGRTRPYGRLSLLNVIADRVYVSTDAERQEYARMGGNLRC